MNTPKKSSNTTKRPTPKSTLAKSQVRIIGGQHKRRLIDFVAVDGLRPTPDRLRETLFNWLMGDLQEACVLDVCAGSGVLGFEAISRGASCATLIEFDKTQANQLKQTAQILKTDNVYILQGDCLKILPNLNTPFDVVFIDPPYALNLWQGILTSLKENKLVHQNSLLYIEADNPLETLILDNELELLKSVKVGQVWAYLVRITD